MQCDVVLIDDVHLLLTKEKTQEQVLAIVDACLASGRNVAIAGDSPPSRLAEVGMNTRLADRLAGGLSVGIHSGSSALRLEVLRKRLDRSTHNCSFADEALDFIVRNFDHSMRETIGALNQLLLKFGSSPVRVDLAMAKDGLKDKLSEHRKTHTLDDLLAITAEVMGVSVEAMKGKARPQELAKARHAYVHCGRDFLKESLPRISAVINRDHTTALSSSRRAEALLERDKIFSEQIATIKERLER